MTAWFWPDLAHVTVFLEVFGVAALAVGVGALVGARRVESALMAGWGVAGLVTVVVGTLTPFRADLAMQALGAAGLVGLAWLGVSAARGAAVLPCGTFMRVMLLGLPFLACIVSMDTAGWDDFSHWLPNLAYLCRYGHFPTLAVPSISDHAAYPYGLALPGYAIFLLDGLPGENAAIVANVIAMLAGAACIAHVLESRLPRSAATAWSAAALGVLFGGLACPTFVPKIVLSNMADSPSGSALVVLAALVFDWWRSDDRGARVRIACAAAACGVAFINLRQANFALFLLLLIGLFGAAMLRPRPRDRLLSLSLMLPFPLLTWVLWGHYTKLQIPGGAFEILPVAQWHWAEIGSMLASILHVMVSKVGLFGLILVVVVRAVLALRRHDPLAQAERALLLVSVVVCAGNIGFLAFTYLAASFGANEAAAAASFWRYTGQTGPLAVLAFAASVPLGRPGSLFWRRTAVWASVVALVLPVATVKLYRHDLTSPVNTLRRIALAADAASPAGTPLPLIDLTGNGFSPVVVAYQIWIDGWHGQPRETPVVAAAGGFSVAQARTLVFPPSGVLWLADGAPEMQPLFGPGFHAGCAYLLRGDGSRFSIEKSWPLGPFVHPVNHDGWTLARANACP